MSKDLGPETEPMPELQPEPSSDSARFLTHYATRERLHIYILTTGNLCALKGGILTAWLTDTFY